VEGPVEVGKLVAEVGIKVFGERELSGEAEDVRGVGFAFLFSEEDGLARVAAFRGVEGRGLEPGGTGGSVECWEFLGSL